MIQKVTFDVKRLDKSRFFEGKPRKDGTVPLYCELTLMSHRDGPDEYGNAGFTFQGVSKEERLNGVKMPTIGNYKEIAR